MNSKDMELSNSVLSFGQAKKIKSYLNITSALTLFLFVVLPFYVNSDGVMYGFKTFQLISGLEFFNAVGNSAYDLRWLVYLFQFYLVLDVLFSLISFKIYDLKIFYLTNLARHTAKLFLSVALLVACFLDQGGFVFNSLWIIILIACAELVYDNIVLRKQVYQRYRHDYPYRFMFFATVVITIFTLLPLIKEGSLLAIFMPQGNVDDIQFILAGVGSLMFVAVFINLLISIIFSVIFRSYVNKIENGFDIWRSISMVVSFGILLPLVNLAGSPEHTYHCFLVASVMSLIQLGFSIFTRFSPKKAKEMYELSIKEKPWLAKYEENSWYNISILPVSIAFASLVLCLVNAYNVDGVGYSLLDLLLPDKSGDILPLIGHGAAVEFFAFLTLLLCFSNFVISVTTMFVKTNKLFEMVRFGSLFVISMISYIVIATSSKYVNHWPLIILLVINGAICGSHLLRMYVLNKKVAPVSTTTN